MNRVVTWSRVRKKTLIRKVGVYSSRNPRVLKGKVGGKGSVFILDYSFDKSTHIQKTEEYVLPIIPRNMRSP